jgi:hypothetical protein
MSKNQSSHPQSRANRAAIAALFPTLAHHFPWSRNIYTHNYSQAHPDTAPATDGLRVWSSAFRRPAALSTRNRVNAELQTRAVSGCAHYSEAHPDTARITSGPERGVYAASPSEGRRASFHPPQVGHWSGLRAARRGQCQGASLARPGAIRILFAPPN